MVDYMTSVFSGLGEMITSVAGGIYSAFAGPLNAVAKLFNSTLGSLSITIPDWVPMIGGQEWGIPKIPLLAEGTDNHIGGSAIVGERGPELVNLPKGAEVIPNNKITAEAQTKGGQQKENNNRPTVVKLMLNERELGSAIMDQFNKKMSTAFSIG
jgi:phage-related protein